MKDFWAAAIGLLLGLIVGGMVLKASIERRLTKLEKKPPQIIEKAHPCHSGKVVDKLCDAIDKFTNAIKLTDIEPLMDKDK